MTETSARIDLLLILITASIYLIFAGKIDPNRQSVSTVRSSSSSWATNVSPNVTANKDLSRRVGFTKNMTPKKNDTVTDPQANLINIDDDGVENVTNVPTGQSTTTVATSYMDTIISILWKILILIGMYIGLYIIIFGILSGWAMSSSRNRPDWVNCLGIETTVAFDGLDDATKRIMDDEMAVQFVDANPPALGLEFMQMTKTAYDPKTLAERVRRVLSIQEPEAQEVFMKTIRYDRPPMALHGCDVQRVYVRQMKILRKAHYNRRRMFSINQVPLLGSHIKGCTNDSIPASIVRDLYLREIIICEAPLQKYFELQWEMIWQRKAGVIIWLDYFRGKFTDCIRPYISIDNNREAKYGRFDVYTLDMKVYKKHYGVYTVVLRNRQVYESIDLKGQETRQIIIYHLPIWRKDLQKVDDEGILHDRLSSLVEAIRLKHFEMSKRNQPAMVVHDKEGLAKPASFVGTYLNRQMMERFNVIEPLEMFRYLERVRYNCFGSADAYYYIRLSLMVSIKMATSYGGRLKILIDLAEDDIVQRERRRRYDAIKGTPHHIKVEGVRYYYNEKGELCQKMDDEHKREKAIHACTQHKNRRVNFDPTKQLGGGLQTFGGDKDKRRQMMHKIPGFLHRNPMEPIQPNSPRKKARH